MEEVAAAVAKEAVTVASTGNLAALLVFVLLLGGIIVIVLGALWVARNVTDAPAPGSSR